MNKHVLKIGGSNLKNNDAILKIVQITKQYKGQVFIVVSAFYGVTEKLIKCFHESSNEYIQEIINDAIIVLQKQIKDPVLFKIATLKLERIAQKMKQVLFKNRNENNAFSYGEFISFGEKISASVLCSIFQNHDLNFIELLPEDGLFTDGEPLNATINLEKSSLILNKILEKENYIIPGFYGISDEKEITLLGRGGSDYSASSLANILHAKSLDIWKDVNGFESADPKLVPHTKIIPRIKYDEAAELSYFGAKILHPRTVEPLKKKNIPIRIFNSEGDLSIENPKTIINAKSVITDEVVKSITYNNNFAILKLKGAGLGTKPGILAKVSMLLGDNGINIKSVITSQTQINILLDKEEVELAKSKIESLELKTISSIELKADIAIIALVGEGIINQPGIASRIFSSLAVQEINVQMISFGASEVAIYFIVDEQDKIKALKLTHQAFFKTKASNFYKLEPYDTF